MHRPICSRCEVEMRPSKNNVVVVDYAHDPPQPYQIWSADEWTCPKCGHRIIVGFGESPYIRHFEPLFADRLERTPEGLRRNNYEYRDLPADDMPEDREEYYNFRAEEMP